VGRGDRNGAIRLLKGAILEGAILEDVKGLTPENITRSKPH
jgi:hypothetical protein